MGAALFVIRRIRPEEWPAYRDIRLAALRDSPDSFGSTYEAEVARPDELWSSRVLAASTSGMDLALLAEEDGAACGLAWCKISSSEPGLADVFQMWVAPGSRGRGAGRALLGEIAAWARGAGVRTLRLGVTVADSPAMRLYRSFGFRPEGPTEPLREGSTLMAQTLVLALAFSS